MESKNEQQQWPWSRCFRAEQYGGDQAQRVNAFVAELKQVGVAGLRVEWDSNFHTALVHYQHSNEV